MLSNYIKTAWRHLTKHKIYSAITISGLVLGLGVFILFALILFFSYCSLKQTLTHFIKMRTGSTVLSRFCPEVWRGTTIQP